MKHFVGRSAYEGRAKGLGCEEGRTTDSIRPYYSTTGIRKCLLLSQADGESDARKLHLACIDVVY
jgi:hypothetical protein